MGSGEVPHDEPSAGDSLPENCRVIEIHVAELKQLFNAIDPSPFREKDLDPRADEFIVSWARDLPTNATLALLVYLDRPVGMQEEVAILRDAIHEYFSQRGIASRRRLRQLFRLGRTNLFIGITCLAGSLLLGDAIASALHGSRAGELLRESLLIGGWVAMWRPMEVFLYDWWPIWSEARLFDRLTVMPVRIALTGDAASEAWRWDWPIASPTSTRAQASRSGATGAGSVGRSSQDRGRRMMFGPSRDRLRRDDVS